MKETTFTRALKRWRKDKRYTQATAAKMLGVPVRTFEKYCQGVSRPIPALRTMILNQIKGG